MPARRAPPGAALAAAIEADFGGALVYQYGAVGGWRREGEAVARPVADPQPPALPAADGALDACVCAAPTVWYGEGRERVVAHLLPAGGVAGLAAVGAAVEGAARVARGVRPPDAPRPPPASRLAPLLAVCTCEESGRAWALREAAERTLGDALRFAPGPLAGSGALVALLQLAQALAHAEQCGAPPLALELDDVLLGGGGVTARVAPRAVAGPGAPPPPGPATLAAATAAWTSRTLPTYDYLLLLNRLAGRRWGDPGAHPALPWVLDFSAEPDAATMAASPLPCPPPPGWRDLTRTAWRLARGDEQLAAAAAGGGGHVPGDALSELGYCVSLARRLPKTLLTRAVRREFRPGEYPASLARLVAWTADDAPPEAFSDAAFCASLHPDLPDLAPPPWAPTGAAAIAAHGAALESAAAASRVPAWIDLTFGAALSGPAAAAALNTAPSPPPGVIPGSGRVRLFDGPHPGRRVGGGGGGTVDAPPPLAPLAGVPALGRLAVQLATGRALFADPGDGAWWRAAAAALAPGRVADVARAALAPAPPPASDLVAHPAFDGDIGSAVAVLDGLDAAAAAAAAAGAGRAAAGAASLARVAAADGPLAAATRAGAELALPALLDALRVASSGAGADASAGAARAAPLLLARLPPGAPAVAACTSLASMLHGNAAGPPPAAAALLRPALVAAALRGAGPDAVLSTLVPACLDAVLAGDGGGAGDALAEAAARLPRPAALARVVAPLLAALAAGPAPAAALAAVAKSLGGDAAAHHVVPALVAVLAAPAAAAAPAAGRAAGTAAAGPAAAADGALTVLEAVLQILPPGAAPALAAPRSLGGGVSARARLAGPLAAPAAHARLPPRVRCRLAAALLAAAGDRIAADLAPQLLPVLSVGAGGRAAWGSGESAVRAVAGAPPPPAAASASPPIGLAARLAAAAGGSLDQEAGVWRSARDPTPNPPSSPRPPPPADAGYWSLVHAIYPDLLEALTPAVLRGALPGWASLEGALEGACGWAPPRPTPPTAADAAASAALVARAAEFAEVGTGDDEGGPAAAAAAALLDGAGWARAAGGGGPTPPPPRPGRWAWLPAGVAPPARSDGAPSPPWSDASRWLAPPPRSAAAAAGPPAWRLAAAPLVAWRAHRDSLSALAAPTGGEGLATAGPGAVPGSRVVRVWDPAAAPDAPSGGEYAGHGRASVTALAWLGGSSVGDARGALASLDARGGLHLWRPTSLPPAGGGRWTESGEGGGGSVVAGSPFSALDGAARAAATALAAGGADGAAHWVDPESATITSTVRLWAADAVTAVHGGTSGSVAAAGSAGGRAALADARACGRPAAGWTAHAGSRITAVLLVEGTHAIMTAVADGGVRWWDARAAGAGAGPPPASPSRGAAPPLLADWPALLRDGVAGVACCGTDALLFGGRRLVPLPAAPAAAPPPLAAAPRAAAVVAVALLPASRLLVVGCEDGKVVVCR